MKNEPIRVMFYADGYDLTSGYSNVATNLAKRLAKDKRFSVFFQEITTIMPTEQKNGVYILPCFFPRTDSKFLNVIANHIKIFGPHIFIPICDPFLLERDKIHNIKFNNIKLMPYAYFDSEDITDNISLLTDSDKILVPTEHSQKILSYGNLKSDIIYNGVDFDLFTSCNNTKKERLRLKFDIDKDKKVFLFVGRNISRKRPERLLESIALFNKQHPSNKAHFLLHMADHNNNQYNLQIFIKRLEKKYNIKI
jgi:glycosyltransferase involved in cell wall biosynthesis